MEALTGAIFAAVALKWFGRPDDVPAEWIVGGAALAAVLVRPVCQYVWGFVAAPATIRKRRQKLREERAGDTIRRLAGEARQFREASRKKEVLDVRVDLSPPLGRVRLIVESRDDLEECGAQVTRHTINGEIHQIGWPCSLMWNDGSTEIRLQAGKKAHLTVGTIELREPPQYDRLLCMCTEKYDAVIPYVIGARDPDNPDYRVFQFNVRFMSRGTVPQDTWIELQVSTWEGQFSWLRPLILEGEPRPGGEPVPESLRGPTP